MFVCFAAVGRDLRLIGCRPFGTGSSHVIPALAGGPHGIYGCVLPQFLGAFGLGSAPYQPIEHPECDEDDRTNDALGSMFDDELDDRVHAFCFKFSKVETILKIRHCF